jgi:hypothetical protein
MKKIFTATLLMTALVFGVIITASAQRGSSYKNALGMRVDFGTGATLVGFSGKHFFDAHNAGEAQLLFGTGVTILGVEYQYHGEIPNAAGLRWYAGLGPALAFTSSKYSYNGKGQTSLLLRPIVGLDYKINNVPLNIGFDWRPIFGTGEAYEGNRFTAARFGLAFRYAF